MNADEQNAARARAAQMQQQDQAMEKQQEQQEKVCWSSACVLSSMHATVYSKTYNYPWPGVFFSSQYCQRRRLGCFLIKEWPISIRSQHRDSRRKLNMCLGIFWGITNTQCNFASCSSFRGWEDYDASKFLSEFGLRVQRHARPYRSLDKDYYTLVLHYNNHIMLNLKSGGCQQIRTCLWRARSWLYCRRLLQLNTYFTAFFEIHKICSLLYGS